MNRLLRVELAVAALGTVAAVLGHGLHCPGLEEAAAFLAVSGLSLLAARVLDEPPS